MSTAYNITPYLTFIIYLYYLKTVPETFPHRNYREIDNLDL